MKLPIKHTVTAETTRLMAVAKASLAAHAAVIRASRLLAAPNPDLGQVRRLLSTASTALGYVPGQLNHYVPADSDSTVAAAYSDFGLPMEAE